MSRFNPGLDLEKDDYLVIRERIFEVFKLQADAFEAISHDPEASVQAVLIVALVALLLALGSSVSSLFGDLGLAVNLFIAVVWTFMSWILWAGIVFLGGRLLSGGPVSFRQILRVTGFAYAPQALAILPWFGALVGAIWTLAAGFVATRQVLGLDNRRSVLIMTLGLIVYVGGLLLIALALEFIRQLPV